MFCYICSDDYQASCKATKSTKIRRRHPKKEAKQKSRRVRHKRKIQLLFKFCRKAFLKTFCRQILSDSHDRISSEGNDNLDGPETEYPNDKIASDIYLGECPKMWYILMKFEAKWGRFQQFEDFCELHEARLVKVSMKKCAELKAQWILVFSRW